MKKPPRLVLPLDELAPGTTLFEMALTPAELELTAPELAGPVSVRAAVTRSAERVRLELDLGFCLRLECSRCGVTFDVPRRETFRGLYVRRPARATPKPVELTAGELDEFYLAGDVLDLAAPIRDTVILAIPMAPTCRPDCPGVCPQCGQPAGSCSCAPTARRDSNWQRELGRLRRNLKRRPG